MSWISTTDFLHYPESPTVGLYVYLQHHNRRLIMTLSLSLSILSVLLLLNPTTHAIDQPINPTLSTNLKLSLTHLDYMNSLSDSDFIYDFNTIIANPYDPGSVLNANAAKWPILSNAHQTVAQLNLGPCAMLAPHLHPRGTNIVVAVSGSTRTRMQSEDGAKVRETSLKPGQMTIFPQASMHTMYNEGCGNNLLYSFLDNNDPGTLNMAQAFMQAGQDTVMQVMPFIHLTDGDFNETITQIPKIGTGSQEGFEACRRRCGIA